VFGFGRKSIMANNRLVEGFLQLSESAAGIYSLLAFGAVVGLTLYSPATMGSVPLTTFLTIVVPALGILEHLNNKLEKP
jgi:uncharacterized membrane protein YhiD involved in acid resistance